ncbi:hypothetical protein diail_10478 [Diaporthe ilicicola]|nr:hypothetical protein diail_10478 [Diaporthe ilicicola]
MSGSSAQTREIKVDIAVQPPSLVGVNRRLIPPVVARVNDPQLIEDYMNSVKDIFATLMLTAGNGQDQTVMLSGNYNVRGQPVTVHGNGGGGGSSGSSSSSSSRHQEQKWIYFIFTGLSIQLPGTYTCTVCVNSLDYSQNFVLTVGGKATRQFQVVNEAVVPARPGKLMMLSRLTDLEKILTV